MGYYSDNPLVRLSGIEDSAWEGAYESAAPYPKAYDDNMMLQSLGAAPGMAKLAVPYELYKKGIQAFVVSPIEEGEPWLPSNQKPVPENVRSSPGYRQLLEKLRPMKPCFIGAKGQILREPPDPRCDEIWDSVHQVIPPENHIQVMRDLLWHIQNPPRAQATATTKVAAPTSSLPSWALPAAIIGLGGLALFYFMKMKK